MKAGWIVLSLLFLAGAGRIAAASDPDEKTRVVCGVNAFYLLLQLEGQPTSLARLEAALPPTHEDGYSMAKLAQVAHSIGLNL